MTIKKQVHLSRAEALKYLIQESPAVVAIISASISNLVVFALSFTLLAYGRFINYDQNAFIIIGILFGACGIPQYFIKKQEYALFDKSSSDIFLNDIFSYPVYILLFTGALSYFFLPGWQTQAQDSLVTMLVTVFGVALLFSYIFIGLWKLFTFYLLSLFSGRDWVILAEKDYFMTELSHRFEESRRYGVPLSVVSLTIAAASGGNIKKLQREIYSKTEKSLREIDTIAHFNDESHIYMLSPITSMAAKGMMERIAKMIQEMVVNRYPKAEITLEMATASTTPEVKSEFDLLRPQITNKVEIKPVLQ